MIQVILKYGLTRQIQIDVEPDTRVIDIMSDPNHLQVLGAPESVSAVVNGVAVSGEYTLENGDIILLEKLAAKKA